MENKIPTFSKGKKIDEPFFSFNSKVLSFGHGAVVYPMAHITRVGTYEMDNNNSDALKAFSVILLVAGFALFALHWIIGLIVTALGAFAISAAFNPKKTFAFGIATTSGETRYILTKDEKFISSVVQAFVDIFENSQSSVTYKIDMKDVTIEKVNASEVVDRSIHNSGVIGGGASTG